MRTPPRPPKMRMDTGNGRGSDLAPGRGSLLQAFGAWGGAGRPRPAVPRPERRASARHRVECLAWVGWKTWRRFHLRDALMINLSRGGARIFLDDLPPADRPVWVFLETPRRHEIVRARVVEVRRASSGQCVARVTFDEPCPYDVFEAAVCGLTPADPRRRASRPASAPVGPVGRAV